MQDCYGIVILDFVLKIMHIFWKYFYFIYLNFGNA